MSKTWTGSTRAGVVSALLLAGLTSGCGASGSGWHAGVAAQVGDGSVSVSTVNAYASGYCDAVRSQLNGQVVPMRYLRGGVVGQLAMQEAARQFAAPYGVQPGDAYDQRVADLESAVADLPADQQEAVIAVESASAYVDAIVQAVGTRLLVDQGVRATEEQAGTAGQEAFAAWLADHEIVFDPQFSTSLQDGQPAPANTSLSFAVGDDAVAADAEAPDPAYAAGLPGTLRCG